MTNHPSPRGLATRGITLLELAVAITVLIGLISIVAVGSRAWKRGSDRAACVITLRSMQLAARSYQNLYGYNYGGRPYAENGTQDIALHLYDKGYIDAKLYGQAIGTSPCQGGGTYSRTAADVFPEPGELYMNCSRSETDAHLPNSRANW